jgi:hypothetical protein
LLPGAALDGNPEAWLDLRFTPRKMIKIKHLGLCAMVSVIV